MIPLIILHYLDYSSKGIILWKILNNFFNFSFSQIIVVKSHRSLFNLKCCVFFNFLQRRNIALFSYAIPILRSVVSRIWSHHLETGVKIEKLVFHYEEIRLVNSTTLEGSEHMELKLLLATPQKLGGLLC